MKREPFASAAGMKWRRHRALALLAAGLAADVDKSGRGNRQVAAVISSRLSHGEDALPWSLDDPATRGTTVSTLEREWFEEALRGVAPQRRSLAIRSSGAVDALDAWTFFATEEEAKQLRKDGWTFWVSARAHEMHLPAGPPLAIGYFAGTSAEDVAAQLAEGGLHPAFRVEALTKASPHCHIQILCDRNVELATEHVARASKTVEGSSCDLCVVLLKEGLPERARTRVLLDLRDALKAGGLIVGWGDTTAALELARALVEGLTEEIPLWQQRFKTHAGPAVLLADPRLATHRLTTWTPPPAWEPSTLAGVTASKAGAQPAAPHSGKRFAFLPDFGKKRAEKKSAEAEGESGWAARRIRSGPKRTQRGSAPMEPTKAGVADSFGKKEGAPAEVSGGSAWVPPSRSTGPDDGVEIVEGAKQRARRSGAKIPAEHDGAQATGNAPDADADEAVEAVEAEAGEEAAAVAPAARATGSASVTIAVDGSGECPTLTATVGGDAVTVTDGVVGDFVAALAAAMEEVARSVADHQGLRAPGTTGVLRTLAQKGGALRCALVRTVDVTPRPEHVEVVSSGTGALFPVEYLYALEPPGDDAPLCDRAEEGLRAGRSALSGGWCPGCDPTARSAEEQRRAVCPLAFWGAACTIAHRGGGVEDRSAGTPDRALHPLRCVVAGMTDRAGATVTEAMGERLRASAGTLLEAVDWSDWEYYVKRSPTPTMLALLAHRKLDARSGAPQLEMGAASTLPLEALRLTHVRPSEEAEAPLVLLLGSGTGLADETFAAFASSLLPLGGIVVSTIAPMPAQDAPLVAGALAGGFAKAKAPVPLVELIADVRRRLLADGTPALLSLAALGEADATVDAEA